MAWPQRVMLAPLLGDWPSPPRDAAVWLCEGTCKRAVVVVVTRVRAVEADPDIAVWCADCATARLLTEAS